VAENKSKTEGVLKQDGGGAGHGSRIESRGFIFFTVLQVQATS
jgi:hypothetical protein